MLLFVFRLLRAVPEDSYQEQPHFFSTRIYQFEIDVSLEDIHVSEGLLMK